MFKPMKGDPPEEKFPLVFPFLASAKLDGFRCIITPDGPRTSALKPWRNKALQAALSTLPFGLDGELMVDGSFQDASSAFTTHDGSIEGITLHVFDKVDSFSNPQMPFCLRYMEAERAVVRYMRENQFAIPVKIVPHLLINRQSELDAFEASCIELGYEGVMLRKPGGLYKYGRSTAKQQDLLKIKRFEDTEGAVVGFYEQNENNNEKTTSELGYSKRSSHKAGKTPKGTLGGIVVKLDDTWSEETVKIATGWTNDQRDALWKMAHEEPDKFFSLIAKYKFQREGSKDKPRIPIWLAWRDPDDMG